MNKWFQYLLVAAVVGICGACVYSTGYYAGLDASSCDMHTITIETDPCHIRIGQIVSVLEEHLNVCYTELDTVLEERYSTTKNTGE